MEVTHFDKLTQIGMNVTDNDLQNDTHSPTASLGFLLCHEGVIGTSASIMHEESLAQLGRHGCACCGHNVHGKIANRWRLSTKLFRLEISPVS